MSVERVLAKPFRKDVSEESFLEKFNDILAPHAEESYRVLPEKYPTVHIVGAPRSGTTLLSQLLASTLSFGYINNLTASFWRAPVYGIRLSRKLLGESARLSYDSEFGRTQGITEPHEFGYFWTDLLNGHGLEQPSSIEKAEIDWERFRLVINNIAHAFGRPVLFKSVMLAWYIEKVAQVLNRACFVHIRRDPTENALSILRYRKTLRGSEDEWVSLKPYACRDLEGEAAEVQVAAQIHHIQETITRQILRIGQRNVVEVTYEQLCQSPLQVVESVEKVVAANGGRLERRGAVPSSFDVRSTFDPNSARHRRVEEAVQAYFGKIESRQ